MNDPHDAMQDLETLQERLVESRQNLNDFLGDLEDRISIVKRQLKDLALNDEMSNIDFHFRIHVDDLTKALMSGALPSHSQYGCGTWEDARRQAEVMLAACHM